MSFRVNLDDSGKWELNKGDIAMQNQTPRPWGLTRMRPFPESSVVPAVTVVLDSETQMARRVELGEQDLPSMARHKRSETSKETKTKTSLDGNGNADEGSDQQGDTD